ncbi:MAG: hypothetical protein DMG30_10965 [Acidobacteria bacterium]|nr:MAG: hypothetical protein DMG30_10965 [Acidobacteriota bacterium]
MSRRPRNSQGFYGIDPALSQNLIAIVRPMTSLWRIQQRLHDATVARHGDVEISPFCSARFVRFVSGHQVRNSG